MLLTAPVPLAAAAVGKLYVTEAETLSTPLILPIAAMSFPLTLIATAFSTAVYEYLYWKEIPFAFSAVKNESCERSSERKRFFAAVVFA